MLRATLDEFPKFSGGWASVPGSLEGMIASVLSYQLLSWTKSFVGEGLWKWCYMI